MPAGGRFDGIAGVVAALEVVHYLNEKRIELPFDLEIVDYLGEELNVWGTSCLGSRHMAGLITSEMLERIDSEGRRLGSEISRIGGSGQASDGPRSDASQIKACLELHIEQAKILDSNALVAAADIIQKTSALAGEIARDENQHFVATIGKIDVFPNGAAIVPGQVDLTLDLRAVNARARVSFFEAFERACDRAAKTRNCRVTVQQFAAADVAPMNGDLMTMLEESAKANGLSAINISSGAGHDTAHLSRIAPAAMIFIPCRDGLSHCPEEYTSSEAIAKGATVLTGCVMGLANKTMQVS